MCLSRRARVQGVRPRREEPLVRAIIISNINDPLLPIECVLYIRTTTGAFVTFSNDASSLSALYQGERASSGRPSERPTRLMSAMATLSSSEDELSVGSRDRSLTAADFEESGTDSDFPAESSSGEEEGDGAGENLYLATIASPGTRARRESPVAERPVSPSPSPRDESRPARRALETKTAKTADASPAPEPDARFETEVRRETSPPSALERRVASLERALASLAATANALSVAKEDAEARLERAEARAGEAEAKMEKILEKSSHETRVEIDGDSVAAIERVVEDAARAAMRSADARSVVEAAAAVAARDAVAAARAELEATVRRSARDAAPDVSRFAERADVDAPRVRAPAAGRANAETSE